MPGTRRARRRCPPRCRTGIDAVREISGTLGIEQSLRELGVRPDLLTPIASSPLADAVTRNAPRRATEQDILGILEAVF
ncbi:hypothetical protein [Streptomyces lanatus]|uniref:hypothetical protein n=1 Tax=Streptomyces lanatus TaxID=66900 RepID=UPI00199122AB|nr:hypothetical protein GCM10018780_00400 [Streptomyces lanatus]